jgi:hypothetical protein
MHRVDQKIDICGSDLMKRPIKDEVLDPPQRFLHGNVVDRHTQYYNSPCHFKIRDF